MELVTLFDREGQIVAQVNIPIEPIRPQLIKLGSMYFVQHKNNFVQAVPLYVAEDMLV